MAPLETKIKFLNNVVLQSFVTDSPHENEKARRDWIAARTHTLFSYLNEEEFNDLMLLSNTIPTLEKAEATLREEEFQLQWQQQDQISQMISLLHKQNSDFLESSSSLTSILLELAADKDYSRFLIPHSPADNGKRIMDNLNFFNSIHEIIAVENQPTALCPETLLQAQDLFNYRNNYLPPTHERNLVNLFTPELESIIKEIDPKISLINSEEYQWLHGAGNDPNCEMKPDLLVAYHALIENKPPYSTAPPNQTARKFGRFPCWNCRASIWCLFDAKWELDETAFGEQVKYLQLCGQRCKDRLDKDLKLKMILFDIHEFWMVESSGEDIVKLTKCRWDCHGSRDVFKSFVTTTDNWMIATEALLSNLGRQFPSVLHSETPTENNDEDDQNSCSEPPAETIFPLPSILGAGSNGRVYRLSTGEVLKVALGDDASSLLEREYYSIFGFQNNPATSHFVIPVVPDSFRHFDDDFEYAGYLLQYEGSQVKSACPRRQGKNTWTSTPGNDEISLVHFLYDLHQAGIIHGDARLDNILMKDGHFKFIDFMQSTLTYIYGKEKDFAFLFNSMTGVNYQIIFNEMEKIFRPTLPKGFSQMNFNKADSIREELIRYLKVLWSSDYRK